MNIENKIQQNPQSKVYCQSARLIIIIPCFNEEAVLPQTIFQLSHVLSDLIIKNKITEDSCLYFVDDGSLDQTWSIISKAHQTYPEWVKGLKLSQNVGHQNALLAGLLSVKNKADCVVSIDADLQDDINAIEEMLDHFYEGDDIVYGVRKLREKDTFFKRTTAILFYKLMKYSKTNIVYNHADFRLLSKRTLHQLSQFKERNLFLRGIFPLIGYRSSCVYYDRTQRLEGKSKYTLKKMISLAWNGVTSFSHVPLDFIFISGISSFVLSFILTLWVLAAKFFSHPVPGWTSLMIPLCFMGGVQLLSIGILGNYLAKMYLEVKRRPRFIKDLELF